MDDKEVYLNEDNAIFIDGLCKYYRHHTKKGIPESLINMSDDLFHLPLYLFENKLMDEKFVEKYRNSYSNYEDMLNLINDETNKDYDYYYVVIYTIFTAYIYNKNNFDNFSAIVDDVISVNVSNNLILSSIDTIVKNACYKDMPNMRRLLKSILKYHSNFLFALSPVNDLNDGFLDIYKEMMQDYTTLKGKGDIDTFNKILDFRVGKLVDKWVSSWSIYVSVYDEMEAMPYEVYYYNKILLKGNRFFHFNDKLKEVEDRISFRKNISSYLNHFNFELFEDLNEGSKKDSFITCIDIVFDSDSYTELLNKLSSLVEASKNYENGDKEKAFELIKNLNSDSLKEVYSGKLVSYPNNRMNKVEKPKKIVDRMKDLYSKIDSSISYDFIDKYCGEYIDISSMMDSISLNVKYEKSVSTRFKKKMKEIFSRNKG